MKKTLLAIAVAATAATSVNAAEILKTDTGSVDFYGQLRQQLQQDNDEADVTLASGSSRAGVNARYTATDSVAVLGSVEFGIGDSSDWSVRKHYVGLDFGDAGTLTVGKQSITSDDVWGAENSYFGSAVSMLPEAGSNYVGWLQQAMVKYAVDGDAGWLQASYSYDNGDANVSTAEVFAGTSFGAISIYGGGGVFKDKTYSTDDNDTYVTSDDVTSQADNTIKHGMITVAYDADTWNVGATYWHAKNDDKDLSSDSIVVAGKVKVADKTSVYGGYEFVKDFEAEGNDYNNVYVGVEYKYASWARTYAEFGTHTQDLAKDPTDDDGVIDGDNSYWGVGVRVYW